jgi:hypothetical protein
MKKIAFYLGVAVVFCACSGKNNKSQETDNMTPSDSIATIEVKYATGFSVRDSADIRLVDVGKHDHFALVHADDVVVPEGYTKVRVPIKSTICMTALQLSNFTVLDAHDVVKGLTGTKNLFNKDILERVKDGRIVKIGMEGNFDTEMVINFLIKYIFRANVMLFQTIEDSIVEDKALQEFLKIIEKLLSDLGINIQKESIETIYLHIFFPFNKIILNINFNKFIFVFSNLLELLLLIF